MSNLSELLPTGGGQNAVDFVATGTLASGQTVLLKTDGTVEAVGETTVSESIGSASQFASSSSTFSDGISALYDVANNKHVIAYRDNGDSFKGKVVVVTANGESLSFGTPVEFNSGNSQQIDAVYADSLGKFLVQYRDYPDNLKGKVVVGTVSGTSATFGTPAPYADYNENYGRIAWSTDDNVFVVVWGDANNLGESRVGSVSGTTISYGTEVAFETDTGAGGGSSEIALGYTTDSKVVVTYMNKDGSSNRDNYARVGTISGTSISWGARTEIRAGTNNWTNKEPEVCYDPISGKVLISYWAETNNDYPEVIVGTISGTTISFGTPVVVSSNATSGQIPMVYNAAAQKIVIYYAKNNNSSNAFSRLVTISGTTPSLSSELAIVSGDARYYEAGLSYNSADSNVLLAYPVPSAGGSALVYTASYLGTNLSATTFIGITSEAISNTATGAVNVYGGINTAQTGLTIASDYYVQADGRLASGVEYAPYSISGAAYSNRSFSIASQETVPAGLAFNSTGTKMFIVGSANDTVFQYSLSAAYDISSASYDSVSFSVSAQDTTPYGLAFNPTGTKMFIVGSANDAVFQYSLSSAFDLSSASYDSVTLNISAQTTGPFDITFNNDGTKFYIANATGLTVLQYSMSSAYNLATASYDSVSFSTSPQDSNSPRSVAFNGDGTKMFITGQASNAVYQYSLSSAFNVSTASYDSINFSVAAQGETNISSVIFNSSGTAFYALGFQLDTVLEYATTALAYVTTVKAGQAVSATTINMKDLT